MRHYCPVLFLAEILHIFNKGAYRITNLVIFYVGSRKSEILQIEGLLLSKSYKGLAKSFS